MLRRIDLIGLALVLTGYGLSASYSLGQPLAAPVAKPGMPQTSAPSVRAELVDPVKKAAKGWATVKAQPLGVNIVDPALAQDMPRKGEGHFHYQVDSGPVIATTAAKLSFHELSRGNHKITVTLVGNDHLPVAAPVVLSLTVP